MKRYAFHRLIIPFHDEEEYMQAVELNDSGFFLASFPLRDEMPYTIWIGGACILLPESIVPVCGETLCGLLARMEHYEEEQPLCLWSMAGMPVSFSANQPIYRWERIL